MHKVKPVSGYNSLAEAYMRATRDNDEIRSLVLINCGGIVNLNEFLKLEDKPGLTVYVIDSHRPYHLSNVRAENEKVRMQFPKGAVHAPIRQGRCTCSPRCAATVGVHPPRQRRAGRVPERRRGRFRHVVRARLCEWTTCWLVSPLATHSFILHIPSFLQDDSDGMRQRSERGGRRDPSRERAVREYYRGSYYGTAAACLSYVTIQTRYLSVVCCVCVCGCDVRGSLACKSSC